jgi:hypothetical protein
MDELDTSDPDAVRAVTEAIGTLAEAKVMADVVDERLNGVAERPPRRANRRPVELSRTETVQ